MQPDPNVRVRFAPSPTGALHIGGVRTALYNYLFARSQGGAFVLRLEDTDQNRYVAGAEEYILESLSWLGIEPDEGPGYGGDYGPYRQSERRATYHEYARQLVETGKAYYAFDTPEELEAVRERAKAAGEHAWRYDAVTREGLRNSLNLPEAETLALLEKQVPFVIRLRVEPGQEVAFEDDIRDTVRFATDELDDKVLLKADGMPTYHLANVVDDHLMRITHVIRGEEWLSSTAHHVLLYRAFGWEMPRFAHLPLILKPTGKGKLSKRDGQKLGIPVFPIGWGSGQGEDRIEGFREYGFVPPALLNFLAFLGWNPGTEQELFRLEELVEAFRLDKTGKSGARFDYDKARWFNQQYLSGADVRQLAAWVRPWLEKEGVRAEQDRLEAFCELLRERVTLLPDFWEQGAFLWQPVGAYEEKPIRKRWEPERADALRELAGRLEQLQPFSAGKINESLQAYLQETGLKPGALFPFLRLALAGTTRGPGIPDMMAFLGAEETARRLRKGAEEFTEIAKSNA